MIRNSTWDGRHSVPVTQWADLALFAPRDAKAHYVFAPSRERGERLPLHALYQPGTSETLIVVFHGAIDREKYSLPRFEWLGTLSARSEHVLYVSDPTLALSSDLQIGWFVGSALADELARVVRLAERARRTLGVKRLLFMGGSAGGYASLMAAARSADSRALAFNPQITISEYYPRFVTRFLQVALPEFKDFQQARANLPRRLSVLDAIPSSARMAGRALIVQNSGDSFHMGHHLSQLADQLGMEPARALSTDSRVEFDVRYFSEGHTMPYRHVLSRYLDLTLERWDEERVVRDNDDFPIEDPSESVHSVNT